ncbi:MAG: DUF58 domain-containing protein [bacterium]|nr:DUF58 domain-containing protein [bacterium]
MKPELRKSLLDGMRIGAKYALTTTNRSPLGNAGEQLADRAGASLEFMDHRDYQLGDDLRRINWAAYARTEKLSVKLFRQEVSPHLDVVIDASRSMDLPGSVKSNATAAMASLLTTAAGNAGFAYNVHLASDGYRPVDGGQGSPESWQGINFDYAGNPDESFTRLPPIWAGRGIRVLITDLLWMGDPLISLTRFGRDASAVVILQVLARADTEPPEHGNLRLVDSETGEPMEIFIDATARQRYTRNMAGHQENWRLAAMQSGAILTTIIAEDLLDHWHLDDLLRTEVLKVI